MREGDEIPNDIMIIADKVARDRPDYFGWHRNAIAGAMMDERCRPEVVRLVIAARVVAFERQDVEALRELDQASEAFAELVPWENEPASRAES